MKTVLIVDDEIGILEALEDLVRAEGYDVLTARDGQEALERVAKRRPDLVVTDFMMPIMDGSELLSRLHADAATRAVPVFVMSAVSEKRLPAGCRPALFLRKPFGIDRFLDELKRRLS